MNESKKLLIAFAVIGVICCCMAGVGYLGMRQFANRVERMGSGDPAAISEVQERIAEFDLPPGYKPMAMSMVIYDVFYLMPDDSSDGPMIMLMQYGSMTSANREQMEKSLRQVAEQQGGQPGMVMRPVDSFETVIRGETVTVTVSEADYQGLVMRQWMTLFEGNKGPVIMMIQGSAEGWDEELVNTFIQSIR